MNARQLAIIRAARLLQTESARSILNSMTPEEKRLADLFTLDRDAYIQKYFHGNVGKGIGIGEAAREFGVSQPLVSIWVSKGLIKKLGRSPEHAAKILIDKADVEYCVDAMHRTGASKGRKVFNPDGSIYIPKELQLA